MTDRDEFVFKVSQAVREKLSRRPWFRGVCLDGLEKFYPNNLNGAIEHAIMETVLWDGDGIHE